MNRLFIASLAAGAFLLSSCSSDEPLAGPDANGGKVTFIAEFPTETLTRDFGDGSGTKKLSYAVYEVDAEGNASATPLFATGKADSPNFPVIKEAFTVINSLRAIFRNKNIDRNEAKTALHSWYDKVSQCTIREVKSARDAIKAKEEEVLNYFINRSTNASAESLYSKLKGFRSQLHGVSDLPFFMYRISRIFG